MAKAKNLFEYFIDGLVLSPNHAQGIQKIPIPLVIIREAILQEGKKIRETAETTDAKIGS